MSCIGYLIQNLYPQEHKKQMQTVEEKKSISPPKNCTFSKTPPSTGTNCEGKKK